MAYKESASQIQKLTMATNTEIRLRPYDQRDNPKTNPMLIRSSLKAEFSLESKRAVLLDLKTEEVRLQKCGETRAARTHAKNSIAQYYQITVRTLERWNREHSLGDLAPKPKTGRPRTVARDRPAKRRAIETINAENGRRKRATTTKLKS